MERELKGQLSRLSRYCACSVRRSKRNQGSGLMVEKVAIMVRLPLDVKEWIEQEAARNAGSQNSEIVRSIRARMDRDQPAKAAG